MNIDESYADENFNNNNNDVDDEDDNDAENEIHQYNLSTHYGSIKTQRL